MKSFYLLAVFLTSSLALPQDTPLAPFPTEPPLPQESVTSTPQEPESESQIPVLSSSYPYPASSYGSWFGYKPYGRRINTPFRTYGPPQRSVGIHIFILYLYYTENVFFTFSIILYTNDQFFIIISLDRLCCHRSTNRLNSFQDMRGP